MLPECLLLLRVFDSMPDPVHCLFDEAPFPDSFQEPFSTLKLLLLLSKLLQLGLLLIEEQKLLRNLILLPLFEQILVLDLLFCPSPLCTNLHEIRGVSFQSYKNC